MPVPSPANSVVVPCKLNVIGVLGVVVLPLNKILILKKVGGPALRLVAIDVLLPKLTMGLVTPMALSLLMVTPAATVMLDPEIFTVPPNRFRVAGLNGSTNVNEPVPVGAIDIVPPAVASVAEAAGGVLITRFDADVPESTLIADAPVAVIDVLAIVPKVRFGALMCTGPPPLMVYAVPSATVSVLPAAVARKDVVPAAVVWKDPVPPMVKLPVVLCTVIELPPLTCTLPLFIKLLLLLTIVLVLVLFALNVML